jgi:hypothetical protein
LVPKHCFECEIHSLFCFLLGWFASILVDSVSWQVGRNLFALAGWPMILKSSIPAPQIKNYQLLLMELTCT